MICWRLQRSLTGVGACSPLVWLVAFTGYDESGRLLIWAVGSPTCLAADPWPERTPISNEIVGQLVLQPRNPAGGESSNLLCSHLLPFTNGVTIRVILPASPSIPSQSKLPKVVTTRPVTIMWSVTMGTLSRSRCGIGIMPPVCLEFVKGEPLVTSVVKLIEDLAGCSPPLILYIKADPTHGRSWHGRVAQGREKHLRFPLLATSIICQAGVPS